MKYREALRAALLEEMERDEAVFCLGEGIGERGGSYKVTEGLIARFGAARVLDTPLSEAGFVGVATGAAIAGRRPVVELLFIDFLLQAMDQVVNQAAKYRFMSGGEGRVPMVIRTQGGTGNSLAGQHSQSLEALYAHIPGLKVVMPATPRDAKGLLKSAIRDDDPVVFIEHKLLYMTDGDVPEEEYLVPIGQADIKRPGTDVTLVAWSHMVLKSLQAAEELAAEGISVEVVDLRTVAPLDMAPILESVHRTNRLLIAHEAVVPFGIGAEIAATVAREGFWDLDAPIERIGAAPTPPPYAPELERAWLPDRDDIAAAIRNLARV
jgi:acetoin:2,6-dichlorophenolindophenol oxidoreductase subunit beta